MLINLDNLKVLSRHNHSFIREILEVYLMNTPKDLLKMRESVDAQDWPVVRYFAHKLKSSSFTIGFIEGHRRFQMIEQIIKSEGDMSQIVPMFNEAILLCDECITEVKLELTKYI